MFGVLPFNNTVDQVMLSGKAIRSFKLKLSMMLMIMVTMLIVVMMMMPTVATSEKLLQNCFRT